MLRIASVLLTVTLAVTISSCSSSGTLPPITPADLVLTTEPGPNTVDKVVWGLAAGEPTTINPIAVGDDSSNIVNSNLCENVLRLQPNFSVEPGLATRADWVSPTRFIIELRPGIKFWDGMPMTGADLAYSMQKNNDPQSGSVNLGTYANVTAINQTGPLQVTVDFSAHDSQFRNAMASPAGVVFEKAYAEQAGPAFGTPDGGVMCTGPFKFGQWLPGTKIVTTANDDYWQGRAPKVRTLEYRFIPDDSTLTTALAAGEIDGAYTIPNTSINTLRGSKKGRMVFGPGTASLAFGAATKTGPAANPVVRAALDLAINKKDYIATALGGYGAPLKTFTPPFSFSALPAAPVYQAAYDALDSGTTNIEEAKRLIATVKLDRTQLVYAVQAGQRASITAATVVQQAGRQLGLDIVIRQMQATDFANVFYDDAARAGIDFVGTISYVDTPGVLTYASYFALPDGLFNWSGYDDPRVTDLLGQARTDTDPFESAKAFAAAQAIYAPARLQISLAQQYSTMFLSNRLSGAVASFAYINTPWALDLGGTAR